MNNALLTSGLHALADRYDVIFSDVWGVVHNGIAPHHGAGEALTAFRAKGGVVIMISNAPRPNWSVIEQLDRIGVAKTAYDAVVTSGDVTMELAMEQPIRECFFIGADKDEPLFRDLAVARVSLEKASFVICSGLRDDDTETAEDYRSLLVDIRKRNLPMICANPDLVVERGNRLLPCGGAIAAIYEEMGGAVTQAGKPFPRIYNATLAKASAKLGRTPDKARVLAVGDAIRTDIAGAVPFGVDSLFLSAGIHAHDLHDSADKLDAGKLAQFLTQQVFQPTSTMQKLAW
ncbi:MAG: TIGR01459 family HAD-type hydrolase [Beijerinckiaceae bacterium]